MATSWTSGNLSTNNGYVKCKIKYTLTSQNVSKNQSTLTVQVFASRTNTGYTTYGSGSITVTVNGTSYTQSISPSQTITYNSNTELFKKTGIVIPHNTDGTKTVKTSYSLSISAPLSGSDSWSHALTAIPRTSSATLTTTSVTLGQPMKLSITANSTSFTHRIKYTVGSTTTTVTSNYKPGSTSATEYSFTPPTSLNNQFPNASSAAINITVETLNGSTSIGSVNLKGTVTIPSSYIPKITRNTSSDKSYSTGYTTNSGWNVNLNTGVYQRSSSSTTSVLIKGKAYIAFNFNLTKYHSNDASPIRSIIITEGGKQVASKSFTDSTYVAKNNVELKVTTPTTSGTLSYRVVVTDSRGKTATTTISKTILNYSEPTVSGSVGESPNPEFNAMLTLSGSWCQVSSATWYESQIIYKEKGSTSAWQVLSNSQITTTNNPAPTSNTIIGTGKSTFLNVDETKSYVFKFIAHDAFTTKVVQKELQFISRLINFGANGTSIGIGNLAPTNKENLLSVFMDTSLAFSKSGTGTTVVADSDGLLMKSTSAKKYKKDINYNINIEEYRNKFDQLKPGEYRYIDDPESKQLGFFADDISEIDHDMALYNSEGEVENYKDRDIIALLCIEVQAQKETINKQNDLITKLINKVFEDTED